MLSFLFIVGCSGNSIQGLCSAGLMSQFETLAPFGDWNVTALSLWIYQRASQIIGFFPFWYYAGRAGSNCESEDEIF